MSDHLRITSSATTISQDLSSASTDLHRARRALRLPDSWPPGVGGDLARAHRVLRDRMRRLALDGEALADGIARGAHTLSTTDDAARDLFPPMRSAARR